MRVAKYRVEEHVKPLGVPQIAYETQYPHNYGVALRQFEMLVRLDAAGSQVYGPQGRGRLVLRQTGCWERSVACAHCGEAIWQDGTEPGRGIWLHKRRDPHAGFFSTFCDWNAGTDGGVQELRRGDDARAEPGGLVAQALPRSYRAVLDERTAEHAVVA